MAKKILPNDGKHLIHILDTTSCAKHGAEQGVPCWNVDPGSGNRKEALMGACGHRVRKAGFNGRIHPTSFQTKYTHKKKEAA